MLGRLDEKERTALIEELNAERSDSVKIRDVFESCGGTEYVRAQIQTFVDNAVKSITALPDSQAKKALIETARSVGSATPAGQKQS
jgi:geranylgeranyl pyrophosphate synthase